MKAAVYKSYGPPQVLTIEEVKTPTVQADEDGRVLIKVHSASVNPFDFLHRQGFFPIRLSNGFLSPKQQILGIDVAGTVEVVSRNVTRFKVGDHVFGNCLGSHAEYVRARESALTLMPPNLTFHQAAASPTVALSAMQALRDVTQINQGHKVLIIGASGGIGHFAVQLARHSGAEVTAVCSTSNVSWVKDLGANHVIDYTREDFTRNGQKYDIILDASAARTFFSCRKALTETGVYMTENPTKPGFQLVQVLLSALGRDPKIKNVGLTKTGGENLERVRELLAAGTIKPVIEKCYPLEQVAAAHRHVENGHTKGKVVIEIHREK